MIGTFVVITPSADFVLWTPSPDKALQPIRDKALQTVVLIQRLSRRLMGPFLYLVIQRRRDSASDQVEI